MVGPSHVMTSSLLFIYQQQMTSSGLSFVLGTENTDIPPPPSPPHATENLDPKFAQRSSPPSLSRSLSIPWELKCWESIGAFPFPWAVVLGEMVVTCFRAGGMEIELGQTWGPRNLRDAYKKDITGLDQLLGL